MELPTYTNIWRIEKRLYKLYDFRLPMPLPVGQIAVFAAIIVPYVVVLTILGLPFSHSLVWLYLLPPGALTWLATRPVLESKRLPELVGSQLRYLGEPRAWCRMAPRSEPDVIAVSGQVWRRAEAAAEPRLAGEAAPAGTAAGTVNVPDRIPEAWRVNAAARERPAAAARPVPAQMAAARAASAQAGPERRAVVARAAAGPAGSVRSVAARTEQTPARPARPAAAAPPARLTGSARPDTAALLAGNARPDTAALRAGNARPDTAARVASADPVPGGAAGQVRAMPWRPAAGHPPVRIVGDPDLLGTPPPVERRLAGPAHGSAGLLDDRVLLVPGGYRPGAPDRRQRDRSRAQQQIAGPRRVVVLGCTVGAGQTTTTLMTGEMLASLRADPVAVLDLNPGSDSLAAMALARPALSQAATLARSRLEVLSRADEPAATGGAAAGGSPDEVQPAAGQPGGPAPAADPDLGRMFQLASARYPLVLADPSAACLPRLLPVTDQLVLVVPASAAAARAIGMTFDWLESHGGSRLGQSAVVVMNGVSRVSADAVDRAEQVARGWCRAIVRVPWDDQLSRSTPGRPPAGGSPPGPAWTGLLSPVAVNAYTALAGVLVASLAEADPPRLAGSG